VAEAPSWGGFRTVVVWGEASDVEFMDVWDWFHREALQLFPELDHDRVGSTGDSSGDGRGGGGGGGDKPQTPKDKSPCERLKALGLTNEQFERMKSDYWSTALGQGIVPGIAGATVSEAGHVYVGGTYYVGTPTAAIHGVGVWAGTTVMGGLNYGNLPANGVGYSFHAHPNIHGFIGTRGGITGHLNPSVPSRSDMGFAASQPNMIHFIGWDGGLFTFSSSGKIWDVLGSGWANLDCSSLLK